MYPGRSGATLPVIIPHTSPESKYYDQIVLIPLKSADDKAPDADDLLALAWYAVFKQNCWLKK